MATAYTSWLKIDTAASEFILRCTRAMGPLGFMRDEPLDAPIPEEFLPSERLKKELDDARVELVRLSVLTAEQAETEARAEYDRAVVQIQEARYAIAKQRAVYERMLALISAWKPPEEILPLRKYMLGQLHGSIQFDCPVEGAVECYPPDFHSLKLGKEWRDDRLASLTKKVERLTREWDEEIARTNLRNLWLRKLRESLAGLPKP